MKDRLSEERAAVLATLGGTAVFVLLCWVWVFTFPTEPGSPDEGVGAFVAAFFTVLWIAPSSGCAIYAWARNEWPFTGGETS